MAAGYWNAPMRPWLSCRNADVQSLPRGTATRRVHRQRSIISSLPMLHPALNTPFDLRRGEVRIIAKHQFTELPFERSRRREATLCLIVGFEVSKKISHGAVGRRSANTPSLRDFCHVPTLPHQGRDPHYSNAEMVHFLGRKGCVDCPGTVRRCRECGAWPSIKDRIKASMPRQRG